MSYYMRIHDFFRNLNTKLKDIIFVFYFVRITLWNCMWISPRLYLRICILTEFSEIPTEYSANIEEKPRDFLKTLCLLVSPWTNKVRQDVRNVANRGTRIRTLTINIVLHFNIDLDLSRANSRIILNKKLHRSSRRFYASFSFGSSLNIARKKATRI